jgi:hypothetical protein
MLRLMRPVDADLLRLRSEFCTMPGLCPTAAQTARLLSMPQPQVTALLDALVGEGFLVRTVGGIYRRISVFADAEE